jgi:hypothetical protein
MACRVKSPIPSPSDRGMLLVAAAQQGQLLVAGGVSRRSWTLEAARLDVGRKRRRGKLLIVDC